MIRVVVADDTEQECGNPIPRFTEAEGVVVVGLARDGNEALALARALRPDVLLLSPRVSGMDSGEVTRRVNAEGVSGAVLILAAQTDEVWSHTAPPGTAGIVRRDIPRDDLLRAIRAAVQRRPTQAPAVPETPNGGHVGELQASIAEPLRALTEREREVLALVAEGYSNKEIAAQLGLTVGTVKGYVSSILTKLGVADRTQAAVFALRHGLTDSET
jgi:DNA-binding NarL/FixJ family response regulator